MAETLGILVTTDNHLDAVVALVEAAHVKGKEIQAFFTQAYQFLGNSHSIQPFLFVQGIDEWNLTLSFLLAKL